MSKENLFSLARLQMKSSIKHHRDKQLGVSNNDILTLDGKTIGNDTVTSVSVFLFYHRNGIKEHSHIYA